VEQVDKEMLVRLDLMAVFIQLLVVVAAVLELLV
tara:strand:- start:252 stop:353 length:102 start_codon:yes stop_codon:yes gene_type:complete